MGNGKPPKNDKSMGELIEQAAKTTPVALRKIEQPPIPEGHTQICLFKSEEIRQILHDDEWWYSVVDIVGVLSQSQNPSRYWSELRKKLMEESGTSELFDNIEQLKMPGKDGKMYPTDCANAETVFRIVQSVPSPRAEPFKKWLAKTAYERILEMQNPEIAVKRAIASYELQGRNNEWIRRRIETIISRNELTAEWKERGVKEGVEYAVLTDEISSGTFGVTTREHKEYKRLEKRHSLRDHMTGLELVLTMLGEEATKEIAVNTDARGFYKNRMAARSGGKIAGETRRSIEEKSGKKVLSSNNFLELEAEDERKQIPN